LRGVGRQRDAADGCVVGDADRAAAVARGADHAGDQGRMGSDLPRAGRAVDIGRGAGIGGEVRIGEIDIAAGIEHGDIDVRAGIVLPHRDDVCGL
jgi:hypothetical protein